MRRASLRFVFKFMFRFIPGGRRFPEILLIVLCGWGAWGQTSEELGVALDCPDFEWRTGGDAPWTVDTQNSLRGGSSIRSGAVQRGQTTWLETTVTGPCGIGFFWKEYNVNSSIGLAAFFIDSHIHPYSNVVCSDSIWRSHLVQIDSGPHVLRWQYPQDPSTTRTLGEL